MATATTPRNSFRVWQTILKLLATDAATKRKNNTANVIRNCWVSAGAPSSTAPTDMRYGDFILDSTTSDVYVYEGTTTYTKITS